MSPLASKNKDEIVQLRVTARDKAILQKAAKQAGLSMSSFVLTKSLRAARDELQSLSQIILDDTDRDLVLKLLTEKPKPSARLRAAFRKASQKT